MSSYQRLCTGVLLIILATVLPVENLPAQIPETNASGSDTISNRERFLESEAATIANESSELETARRQFAERSAGIGSRTIQPLEIEQAELAVETRRVAQQTIELSSKSALQTKAELSGDVQQLEEQFQTLAAVPRESQDVALIARARSQLTEKQTLLKLEQRHIDQLEKRKQLAKDRTQLAEQWLSTLKEAFRSQQETAQQTNLDELSKQVVKEQEEWQAKAAEYRQQVDQLKDKPESAQLLDLAETRLSEAEESVFLSGFKLKIAQSQARFDKIVARTKETSTDLRTLKSSADELDDLKRQLDSLRGLITSKSGLLEQRREVITKRHGLETDNRKEYQQLLSSYEALIERFKKQSTELSQLRSELADHAKQIESQYLERKKRGLTERHRLPNTLEQWELLLSELQRLPDKVIQIIRNILISLIAAASQIDLAEWSLLLTMCLAWSLGCLALGWLKRPLLTVQHHGFSRRALIVSTSLLRGIRFSLLIGGVLFIAGWVLDIVPPGLAIIGILFGIWIGTRLTIGLSHWILNSPIGMDERQPGLHRLVVILAVIISLFTLGLALGYLDFLSQPLKDLFNRSFMLLLLPPAYLALRIRNLWYGLLVERKGSSHWIRLVGLVGLVIPLAIFAAALLGLFGYINLAWTVGRYLAIAFTIVISWMIARGVVMDLAKLVEAAVGRRSERSGFWIKSMIEPLQYLARLALFLAAIWILYRVFVEDPATGLDLKAWLGFTLFSFGGTSISILNLFGSLLLLLLVFYIGRWAREVTYGWIYANIRDIGIRNSLSVFTQYAVVVIGLLVALNILGINLTSLAVFAGALGVGIGFGLQNIANNFISGLILLAERPVRARDWVTIGDKEGTVAEIGMRSVTVTTWDNQDVIIPNSELISNSFINWTRTDSEVRTVLLIGVSYHADPHQAAQVILDAVTMQPEVSLTPRGPQVFLIDFAASSVNFRIQYFTDVQRFSRLDVQSKVLFAIWDALKEADIGIPFPQQDVYIKELPPRLDPKPG
ncbi:MAG: mechanosensitive ion channel [Gammaproteobacteria bacterium]|nr:mechanosensitive ion channel [Gammaproteobacteria bacterium]